MAETKNEIEEKKDGVKTPLSSFFKKSLIIPAVIIGLIAIALSAMIISGKSADKLTDVLIIWALGILIYLPVVQLIWDTEPISSIILWGLTKPCMNFGLIFELDLDGIIWFLTVKLALWLLSIVLVIITAILALAVSILIAPISFPFALYHAIKHSDDIGW